MAAGPLPRTALSIAVWTVLHLPSSAQVPLEPQASTLPGRVTGRVVRNDGLPQPDAEVVLSRRRRDGSLQHLPWRGRSGFDGRYDITGVPPGDYLVLVRAIGADSQAPGRPAPTLFPGVPVTEHGTSVGVLAGLSTEGIDVWLAPSPRRFPVSGRVKGPEGTVFDSVAIEVGRPGERATDVWTTDDPGGVFSIEAAPPGTLVLRAHARRGEETLTGFAVTTAAATPVDDVSIEVRPQVQVTGRVTAPPSRPLPGTLSVRIVPRALRPTALHAPDAGPVDVGGLFRVVADRVASRLEVLGLPPGWAVRRVSIGARTHSPDALVLDEPGLGLDVLVGPGR